MFKSCLSFAVLKKKENVCQKKIRKAEPALLSLSPIGPSPFSPLRTRARQRPNSSPPEPLSLSSTAMWAPVVSTDSSFFLALIPLAEMVETAPAISAFNRAFKALIPFHPRVYLKPYTPPLFCPTPENSSATRLHAHTPAAPPRPSTKTSCSGEFQPLQALYSL